MRALHYSGTSSIPGDAGYRGGADDPLMTTLSSDTAPPQSDALAPATDRRWARRTWFALVTLLLAVVAYLPLLLSRPGVSTPDTKTYLYLNPGRFIRQVASMWDTTVGAGSVTHEYVGYLFPMGPFFWGLHAAHVPLWVAQRLWLGSILFAAGAGVAYLCRKLDLTGPAALAAGLLYMLSPYLLQYAGRISVILLPWAGLPWMLAFTMLALRRGGWRYPALFALVVLTVSSINASSIIYVGFAPVLWILFALLVQRSVTLRRALVTTGQIGLLTVGVSVWWIIGLSIEAGYGVNVLKYTETVYATSGSSSAAEIIRGLGYWYFYGFDRLGPWTHASVVYTQHLKALVLSYGPPLLALIAAAFFRWRLRAYFMLLIVIGMVWSVGAHPYDDPTPFGSVLKAFMTKTTAGLAMRSTDRATPLVILGLAVLLAAGLSALWRRFPKSALPVALVAIVVVLANAVPIARGDTIANDFSQPASLPKSERLAIRYLNSVNPDTRVLAIPGNDFASFRWGNTVDTPQPAFLNRPFLIHEQQVMGSMATADMLYALDDPIQQSTANPAALSPIARLMSIGNLLVQYDTQYEHFGQPHPLTVANLLRPTPPGLTGPVNFGKPAFNRSIVPTLDEQDLAAPNPSELLPKVAVYGVEAPRPLLRTESQQGALVLSGDGTGLVNLAPTGLLDTTSAVFYAGTLAKQPARLHALLAGGAGLVISDTNRKQGFRWDTISSTAGATETPTEDPAKTDPTDAPIDLFPAADLSAKTMAAYIGARSVSASTYGSPFSFIPEDRAFSALDGNLDTAWRTGIFANPRGEWWRATYTAPVTTDHLTLIQPQNGSVTRWITKVGISFDGGPMQKVDLGPDSRTSSGQVVSFPSTTFSKLKITILHTSNDKARGSAASEVGFAEVQVPGHTVTEVLTMPSDLATAAGPRSIANRLTLAMTRWRSSPYPTRFDAEPTIDRIVTIPTARTFTLSGGTTLSTLIPDDQIDRLLGRPAGSSGQLDAYSSGRLPGSLANRASATLDRDPSTYWQPGFGTATAKDSWLQYNLPTPVTISTLPLTIVNDGRHSVPTSVVLSTEQGSRTLAIPPLPDQATPGATTTVDLPVVPPLTGRQIKLTFPTFRKVSSASFNTTIPLARPIGIAEVGLPGTSVAPLPAMVPVACRSDLLSIDGHPVDLQITGSTADALRLRPLSVSPCGNSLGGIALAQGTHVIETALGHQTTTGWNLDQVTLDSAAGGGAGPLPVGGVIPATPAGPTPTTSAHLGTTTATMTARHVTGPFEVVLGESINSGWTATATTPSVGHRPPRSVNLGTPELIDGYANGWHLTKHQLDQLGLTDAADSPAGATVQIALRWTPQSRMNLGLLASAVATAICLVLVVLPRRRRRDKSAPEPGSPDQAATATGEAEGGTDQVTVASLTRREVQALLRSGEGDADQTTEPGGSPIQPETTAQLDRIADPPVVISPLTPSPRRPAWWVIVIATILTGGFAAAVSSPISGLGIGIVVALCLSVRHLRAIPGLAAIGFFVASVVNVVRVQSAERFGPGDWPSHFTTAGVLMWVAVVLIAADGVIGALGDTLPRRPSTQGDEPGEPSEIETDADQDAGGSETD